MSRQPLLHDLALCLRAPTVALSGTDGQIADGGVQGVFHADVRVLSRARLDVGGAEPEPIAAYDGAPGEVSFVGLARNVGDPGPDPTVRVTRNRTALVDGLDERVVVTSTAAEPVETTVRLSVAADLAAVHDVRAGAGAPPVDAEREADRLRWSAPGLYVDLTAPGADPDAAARALTWRVVVPPRGTTELRWSLRVRDERRVVVPVTGEPPWARPAVRADDPRLAALLERSLADLDTLRLAPAELPGETFLAAGAPWYFTLFGRDSLWAARMLLPLGTGLAASTLRTLAHYQGRRHDVETAEAPGKVMHELRRSGFTLSRGEGGALPPLYYGTVDATLLWVLLLHDAWRWGMPADAVEPLLPHLEAAMGWLASDADPDGDGFVEYVDESGHGLANQGWKDSYDSVRFRDGRIAEAPIALAEVQGYAHAAALAAADLLDAFGRAGADRWRTYAAGLAAAFRRAFWVEDEHGPYPALALDRDKRPVDALASNAGHLLGTGLLDESEARLVAARLTAPDMCAGYGLRTMSASAGGYAPLSYHCGSVWPHDTAIVALGMAREGLVDEAARLVTGLVEAAPAFGYRLPELYGGDGRAETPRPIPYPSSCRPQAWSAASAVAALQVLLGLRVDVPAGVVELRPPTPSPVGELHVDGLVAGAERLTVVVDRSGEVVRPRQGHGPASA
ncbi:MAG TPA: glycogen debranching N-terminal domain-containing protein [Streptosporangiales bacterium]